MRCEKMTTENVTMMKITLRALISVGVPRRRPLVSIDRIKKIRSWHADKFFIIVID